MFRNNAWAKHAIEQAADSIIGSSLRLQYMPDYRALGLTPDQSLAFTQEVEGAWRQYAEDPLARCDVTGQQSIAEMMRLAFIEYLICGDAAVAAYYLPSRGSAISTSFLLVDADRISTPAGEIETTTLRNGIRLDRYGAPLGYYIRGQHPGEYAFNRPANALKWSYIPRANSWGRLQFVHHYDKRRPGQTRGQPEMAAVLKRLRMLEKRSDLELQAAAVAATFAAFIKSNVNSEDVFEMFSSEEADDATALERFLEFQADYHKGREFTLGDVKVGHLLPTEDFEFKSADTKQNNGLEQSERVWLRHVAAGLNVSYEQLAADWSNTNYSSARAALNEAWKNIISSRKRFTRGMITPMFMLWLEEALAKGVVKYPAGAPYFGDAIAAYVRAEWLGPGRGIIDGVKEAEASRMRLANNTTTLQQECAEAGLDYDDVIDQRAIEMKKLAAAGLTDVSAIEIEKAKPH